MKSRKRIKIKTVQESIEYQGDLTPYKDKSFLPDRVWDEGTLRIASYRKDRYRLYFYPHNHLFAVGDLVIVKELNQHNHKNVCAGMIFEVFAQPDKWRSTYALNISVHNQVWPEGYIKSGQRVYSLEYNLRKYNICA